MIHDVIDLQLESNNVLACRGSSALAHPPRALVGPRGRRAHGRQRGVRRRRARGLGSSAAAVVVPNYPEPWDAARGRHPDRIRERLGLPSTTGSACSGAGLGPYVGLDQMAEAVLLVPDTVLVVLGFGRGWNASGARHRSALRRRHFTLPAVHPRRAAVLGRVGGCRDVTPPAAVVQPALHDAEQVPRGARGRARRWSSDPTCRRWPRSSTRGRRAGRRVDGPGGHRRGHRLDPRPARRRAARGAALAAVARERYSWPIAAGAYETVLRRVEALAGPAGAAR